ncbi:hypothetical protein RI129_002074 [Pyrocoelia pectoralis]|uniref:CUB domain-containing protein n=1 Tax=Pyrocoelia pectoralis TaxID=417401 RepID=A0AAN7ZLR5_9COLE
MLSRGCTALPLLLVAATNLIRISMCQSKTDDHSELTTMYPEYPQSDMDNMHPVSDINDPCHKFENPDFTNKEFTSPGYPEMYPNLTKCVLVLKAPKNHVIILDFRDYFDLEYSQECKNDFLEVRDGPHGYNDLLYGPFCGTTFPPEITSTDRYLWIFFRSDENIEAKGFRAVFRYQPRDSSLKTPELRECRIDRVGLEEGVISNADIPTDVKEYITENSMPIDCLWAITVQPTKMVQIAFTDFQLSKPNDCENNFIDVFSNRTDLPSRLNNFCGSVADIVSSKSHIMFIRFFARSKAYDSTFKALFTAYRDVDKVSQKCLPDEFDCDDATCIAKELECNDQKNCRSQWDEENCHKTVSAPFSELRVIVIMVVFCLILAGMCLTFIVSCIKKLISDHRIIQEHIRQSREQQLDELGKQEELEKKHSKIGSHSNSTHSSDSQRFTAANAIMADTSCYVPGGDILPILIRSEHGVSPNGDIYSQNGDETQLEMCDSACQTRESLFFPHDYNSEHSSPVHSITSHSKPSPPAPFSTFGYKKENKYRAEAKIEMERVDPKPHVDDKRRPYSVQTTKSAPDVIVTH